MGEAEAIAGWDTPNSSADTVVRTTALTFKIYLLMKRNVMANGLDRRNGTTAVENFMRPRNSPEMRRRT